MSRKSKSLKLQAALKLQRSHLSQPERGEPLARALPERWGWLVPVLTALVTFAAFLPTLNNQFVDWDDHHNLLDNPHYRGLGWTQIRWMWTTFHMGHWLPLTWMSFGLDYLVWGLEPLGYHLTNLVLHATSAAVFYLVARRILSLAVPDPDDRGQAGLALSAGFAALLFALHPLRAESVAWATERRDVLLGLFYLLTILAYLRACERGERGRGWYWGAVGLFACALLSKSMAVSLPAVLLILDVYPLRRLGGRMGWWSEPARRVYLEKIPFVLLGGGASAIAFVALFQIHNTESLADLTVLGRLAISAYGLCFYLWKMILPLTLSPLYELGTVNPRATPFLLSYGGVVALTALAVACHRRVPGLSAAGLAYVAILLPVLGIFHNGPQIAADRYTYLAGLGWAILAGASLLSGWRRRPFLSTGLAACVLVGLGVLTWNQVQVWRDSERLWTQALTVDPKSSIAHYNWGVVLAQQGKLADAVSHYQRALEIRPDFAEPLNNWGDALARQGRLAEASEHFQRALRIRPDFAEAHYNWGAALAQQGKLAEAVEHYRQALRIKPDYVGAYDNLGVALLQQGKLAEAMEHFQRAPDINPHDAARFDLLNALRGLDKGKRDADHNRKGEKTE